jgi:Tfp pilus assembly protein PilF
MISVLRRSAGGLVLGLVFGAAGCVHTPTTPTTPPPAVLPPLETDARLGARQVADVKVALGRTLEKQGDEARALVAYQEALAQDPKRGDAALRIAVLLDQQGRFAESADYYHKAEAAQPDNADIACNLGYSFYLQRRWPEAEAALRKALARQPHHRRAHNNLGLVLAQAGRPEEALAEFRKAGLAEADARVNLAFAQTMRREWNEARAQYQLALAADPSSSAAQKGLQELNAVVARAEAANAAVRTASHQAPVEGGDSR